MSIQLFELHTGALHKTFDTIEQATEYAESVSKEGTDFGIAIPYDCDGKRAHAIFRYGQGGGGFTCKPGDVPPGYPVSEPKEQDEYWRTVVLMPDAFFFSDDYVPPLPTLKAKKRKTAGK